MLPSAPLPVRGGRAAVALGEALGGTNSTEEAVPAATTSHHFRDRPDVADGRPHSPPPGRGLGRRTGPGVPAGGVLSAEAAEGPAPCLPRHGGHDWGPAPRRCRWPPGGPSAHQQPQHSAAFAGQALAALNDAGVGAGQEGRPTASLPAAHRVAQQGGAGGRATGPSTGGLNTSVQRLPGVPAPARTGWPNLAGTVGDASCSAPAYDGRCRPRRWEGRP
jgi:hypothetical protein